MKTNILYTQPVTVNLDFECNYSLMNGLGIRLQSEEPFRRVKKSDLPVNIQKDKEERKKHKMEKVWDGLQSPFFGSDFVNDIEYNEKCRCACGKYIGEKHKGRVCEYCNTIVDFVNADLSKMGWIINDHFPVINPIYLEKLDNALGKLGKESVLNRILQVEYKSEIILSEHDMEEFTKNPFMRKGMIWFYENYEEVLNYYKAKKTNKKTPSRTKLYDELLMSKDKVFTKCIPVISAIMRSEIPAEKNDKSYKLKINTTYKSLIRTSNRLNVLGPLNEFDIGGADRTNADKLLFQMVKDTRIIFEEIFNTISGKKGLILGKVVGGRLDFSARNIIIQQTKFLRADEVSINYNTFMELYRYELLNQYMKVQKCSVMEAESVWEIARINFNPIYYSIMTRMVKEYKDRLWILINRNPSINVGAFMTVKIAHVKEDIEDKTLTLNPTLLVPPNADFDGDMYNVYRIFGEDLCKRMSQNANPRYNLYISQVNGKVNKELMPIKDVLIGFYQFNNV